MLSHGAPADPSDPWNSHAAPVSPRQNGRLRKAGDARFQRAQKRWAEAQRRFEGVYGGKQASQLREKLRAVVASELGPFDTMAAE